MESSSHKNKNVKYILCIIDVSKAVLNNFLEILNESNCEPNKLWDQGRELYNKLLQHWLDGYDFLI